VTHLDGPEPLVVVEWDDVTPLADDGPSQRPVGRRELVVVRGSRRWHLMVAAGVALSLVAVLLPVTFLPIVQARLVTRFVALAVALLGLQLTVGPAGQLSLCHGVYVGLGSYVVSILVGSEDWPAMAALGATVAAGFGGGCLIGLLAIRIRATYLGPVTLSVAVAFPMIVKRFGWLTGGSSGLRLARTLGTPSWFPSARPYVWVHVVVVAVAVIAFVVARNLTRSAVGLAVRAVAENPLSAAAYGINVRRYRVISAGVGAAFGAVGGGLLVFDTPIVGADSYDLFRSLGYYAAVVVGGIGSLLGGVVGAAIVTGVPFILSTYGLLVGPNLVFGLLLLGTTFAAPGGVAAAVLDWFAGVVRVEEPDPKGSGSGRGRGSDGPDGGSSWGADPDSGGRWSRGSDGGGRWGGGPHGGGSTG
jgi:branched-chain amino acid transport system permease protein